MIEQSSPEGLHNLRETLANTRRILFTPASRKPLSEWSNEFIRLGVGSPEPGPFRWERAPYQKEILDVAGDPRIERVVVMSSAQVGKTSLLLNVAGYYIANDPSPTMIVMPDKASAESLSQTKLEPIIDASPALKSRIAAKSKRDGGNRKLEKVFTGGYVVLVSAKSAHSLRSRSVRVLLLDEVDAYESVLGDEGSPIKIAEARTSNFPNRKIILTSTPTIKDFSTIEREFLAGDQRHFHVPCPLCGVYQELRWGGRETTYGIKWDDENPRTARYRCESCAGDIKDSHRLQMMLKGRWVVANPGGFHPSFHISSLYSVWVSWESLVKEWLEINKYPEKIPSFFNLKLGLPYEDKSNQIEQGELTDRCHEYDAQVPTGVGVITAGVDVQHSWIEVGVWGHGANEEMWLLDTYQLIGETSQNEVWEQLADALKTKYTTVSGKLVGIQTTAIDSGDQTELVIRNVSNLRSKGLTIFPTKGFDGSRAVFEWSRYKNAGKPRLGIVGVSQAKGILYQRLKHVKTVGPGYIHFPASVHPEVLDQINSERKITVYDKGNVPKTFWKKLRERNEQLDCLVYAYAAFHSLPKTVTQNVSTLAEQFGSGSGPADKQDSTSEKPPTITHRTVNLPRRTGGLLGGGSMWGPKKV